MLARLGLKTARMQLSPCLRLVIFTAGMVWRRRPVDYRAARRHYQVSLSLVSLSHPIALLLASNPLMVLRLVLTLALVLSLLLLVLSWPCKTCRMVKRFFRGYKIFRHLYCNRINKMSYLVLAVCESACSHLRVTFTLTLWFRLTLWLREHMTYVWSSGLVPST